MSANAFRRSMNGKENHHARQFDHWLRPLHHRL